MKPNFQLIFIIVFIVAAIFGVLVFSGAIKLGSSSSTSDGSGGKVVLWGTAPTALIATAVGDFNDANKSFTLTYVQKSQGTYDQDLLEAFASGNGPDLFFLPDDLAYKYANKVFAIPYTSYPLATFKGVFADAGGVFASSKGILAFPISIDPLMMYFNRGMLDSAGIVYPPATWDDMTADAPLLTEKDDSNKIIKSAIALGTYSNVAHAKDILSALFIQTGNSIVKEDNGAYSQALDSVGTDDISSVLKFYTDFADPNNTLYSWNKSFPGSDQLFSSENLAFYFGHASELPALVSKNPNENFFIAGIPQIKDAKFKATSARVTGIAISSFSKNFSTAFTAANLLATSSFASKFAEATGTAPARRDLLAERPQDAFSPVFYNSALYARSWLDPSPVDTDAIFGSMVDGVLSGSLSVDDAVKNAGSRLQLLLLK